MAMTSSSSSSKRGAAGLRGPRPQPLKVSATAAARGSKKAPHGGPVIVYEYTPKVVHARPQEFMTVVQRLTGKRAAAEAASTSVYAPGFSPAAEAEEGAAACGDPLLLTLGQRQQAAPPPPAAGMLLSPGFIFSPNTMQSIQELSPLF
ncbi:hypothetical protein GUJ93_ZPchr0013g36086 [Zizania palustris]|uniref:VQ domain-containing protein n=1 Tax=Zizania palustris TaxID=103762 RepID=A0A8J6C3D4_ZIZPA|nr:hypothetical protein GUJ93_ZPchr0013g36086 [Zizania palustris]